jgi:nucleotide-binding universal stress UspA family protein
MAPIEHILVTTDFSPASEEALRVAADLARRLQAEITLLHVYEPVAWPLPEGYVLYTPEQLNQLLAETDRLLEEGRGRLVALGAPKVNVRRQQGIISVEVIEEAKRGKYGLLVVGTHGRTGLTHALMGSIAEKVVRTAPCPVLTVRSKE